jgi:hypothetical protein
MPLSDDPWIAEHSIIDPKRLHAVGMTMVFWTQCERILLFIFSILFNMTARVGWIIAHDIGDVALSEKIREFLEIRALEIPIAKLLTSALSVYDACRQNRNTLSHFTVKPIIDDLKPLPDDFVFIKTKGVKAESSPIPSSLDDFRRVALETQGLSIYLWEIYKGLCARRQGLPVTWPPILAVPELLSKPPLQKTAKPKRQRPPSAASRRERKP